MRQRPVGFARFGARRATGRPSRSLLELHMLSADPEHWRSGVGRGLHHHVLGFARERGFEQIVLWVLSQNQGRGRPTQLGYRANRTRWVVLGGHTVGKTRYCLVTCVGGS